MSRVEYKEINGRLDQPRLVLLTPGVYKRSLQALALFNPTDPQNVENTKNYLTADYNAILDKFHDGSPKRSEEHAVIAVLLNVDEQRYTSYAFKSFADLLYKKGDLNLCRNIYMFRDRFQNRCRIANRETTYPSNVFLLRSRIINFEKPQDTT